MAVSAPEIVPLLAGNQVAEFANDHIWLFLGALSVGLAAAILLIALVAQVLVNIAKRVMRQKE